MVFENLIKFIHQTLEYMDYSAHGHWTQISATVIIASISALIQSWGILKQNRLIWKNKSSAALPLSFFIFQFIYFLSYLIYGYKIRSASLIINNIIGILYIPVIIGLMKFRLVKHSIFKNEFTILGLSLLTIPCVLYLRREFSLIAILFIAISVYVHLLREVQKDFSVRNIEPKYIYSVILGASIWFWYGLQINDFGLIVSNALTIVAGLIFLFILMHATVNNAPNI